MFLFGVIVIVQTRSLEHVPEPNFETLCHVKSRLILNVIYCNNLTKVDMGFRKFGDVNGTPKKQIINP